jgi:hypothetical protein
MAASASQDKFHENASQAADDAEDAGTAWAMPWPAARPATTRQAPLRPRHEDGEECGGGWVGKGTGKWTLL